MVGVVIEALYVTWAVRPIIHGHLHTKTTIGRNIDLQRVVLVSFALGRNRCSDITRPTACRLRFDSFATADPFTGSLADFVPNHVDGACCRAGTP